MELGTSYVRSGVLNSIVSYKWRLNISLVSILRDHNHWSIVVQNSSVVVTVNVLSIEILGLPEA